MKFTGTFDVKQLADDLHGAGIQARVRGKHAAIGVPAFQIEVTLEDEKDATAAEKIVVAHVPVVRPNQIADLKLHVEALEATKKAL